VEITFALQLPRDALSVPLVRRVLDSSLHTLGVAADCLTDIEIALTEACTNVLDHATVGEEYEVVVGLNDSTCVVEVVDRGHGFQAEDVGHSEADLAAEGGRGIQLIRALVDTVEFESQPEAGTVVHLEKRLRFREGSPLQRLVERGPRTVALNLRDAQVSLEDRDGMLEAGAASD
jgi:serine/threonine-protein kinase RsbW